MTTKIWLFLLLLFLLLIVLGTFIYVASYLLNSGQPPPTVNVTLTPTAVDTPTPTSMWTPTPTPEGVVIKIKVDGVDANDVREANCNSSPRIEVEVLDSTGAQLQADDFLYNWRFDPPDPYNREKLDSKNYAITYSVPCDRNHQTVTVEVLENGETLGVRGVCFSIRR
jgi:hypothetical protein